VLVCVNQFVCTALEQFVMLFFRLQRKTS